MTAGLPFQNFYALLLFVSGWVFANDRQNFSFCHSGLKARKSFVHLTADQKQKPEGYQHNSIQAVGFY